MYILSYKLPQLVSVILEKINQIWNVTKSMWHLTKNFKFQIFCHMWRHDLPPISKIRVADTQSTPPFGCSVGGKRIQGCGGGQGGTTQNQPW